LSHHCSTFDARCHLCVYGEKYKKKRKFKTIPKLCHFRYSSRPTSSHPTQFWYAEWYTGRSSCIRFLTKYVMRFWSSKGSNINFFLLEVNSLYNSSLLSQLTSVIIALPVRDGWRIMFMVACVCLFVTLLAKLREKRLSYHLILILCQIGPKSRSLDQQILEGLVTTSMSIKRGLLRLPPVVTVIMLQLNNAGLADQRSRSTNLHISYRTRVYSSVQQDITRAFAVDIVYRRNNTDFYVSISTDVDNEIGGSFAVVVNKKTFTVMVNGQIMSDPLRRPLVLDEILVKQMTNFVMVVSSQDFRVEFDVESGIYVRLDPILEDKVRQLTFVQHYPTYLYFVVSSDFINLLKQNRREFKFCVRFCC